MDTEVTVQERPEPGSYAVIDSPTLRRFGRLRIIGINCRNEIILQPDHVIIIDGLLFSVVLAPPILIDEISLATIDDVLANWQVER